MRSLARRTHWPQLQPVHDDGVGGGVGGGVGSGVGCAVGFGVDAPDEIA
jgi:hypothetical protein